MGTTRYEQVRARPTAPELHECALIGVEWMVYNCSRCPLHATCKQPVCGDGIYPAKYLFIGEAPGQHEDEQILPFVGPAGKLLREMIKNTGIESQSYITNVVRCRPPNNKTPDQSHIDACALWTEFLIETLTPLLIITLGATATKWCLGGDVKITRDFGKVFPLPREYDTLQQMYGVPEVMPLIHPAATLHQPKYISQWNEGMIAFVRHIRGMNNE